MKNKRAPKVKVSNIDLKTFAKDQLIIDPFWDDLYNPKVKHKKTKYKNINS